MAHKEKGDADWDYDDAQRSSIADQPKTVGVWKTAGKFPIRIDKMATAHIFSCLRALELDMWNRLSGSGIVEIERRKMVGASVRQMAKYQELEAEFNKRLSAGIVTIGDMLLGSSLKDFGFSVTAPRK